MNDTKNGWRARLAASPWARLGGKLSLYAIGFGALALVGSGRWLAWVPPARGDSLPATTSSASASVPSASVSASASAAPSASSPAEPDADGGVAEPAVTTDGKVAINRATEAD